MTAFSTTSRAHGLYVYSPTNLFPSARTEIIFGSGVYSIGLEDPGQARRVARIWNDFLIDNELGLLFDVTNHRGGGTKVCINLNAFGYSVLSALGYTKEQLEITVSESAQTTVLRAIKNHLRKGARA